MYDVHPERERGSCAHSDYGWYIRYARAEEGESDEIESCRLKMETLIGQLLDEVCPYLTDAICIR